MGCVYEVQSTSPQAYWCVCDKLIVFISPKVRNFYLKVKISGRIESQIKKALTWLNLPYGRVSGTSRLGGC